MNKIKKIFFLIFVFLAFVPNPVWAEEKSWSDLFDEVQDTVSDSWFGDKAGSLGTDDRVQQGAGDIFGAIYDTYVYSSDITSKLANAGKFVAEKAAYTDAAAKAAGRAYEGDYTGAALAAANFGTRSYVVGTAGAVAGAAASAKAGALAGTFIGGPAGTIIGGGIGFGIGLVAGVFTAAGTGILWDKTIGAGVDYIDHEITYSSTADKHLGERKSSTSLLIAELDKQIAEAEKADELAAKERIEEINKILRAAKDPYKRAQTFLQKKYNLIAARSYAQRAIGILEDYKDIYPELLKTSAFKATKVLLDVINKEIANATAVTISTDSDEIEVFQGKDVTITAKVKGGIPPYQYVGANGDLINENEIRSYWKAPTEVGETTANLRVRDNIDQVASKKIIINVIAEEVDQEFKGNLSGTWSGKGTGDFKGWTSNGTFIMNISESGKISGSYTGDDKGRLSGSVSSSGRLNMKSGGGSAGSGRWSGTIKTNAYGTLEGGGTWSVDGFTGSWRSR